MLQFCLKNELYEVLKKNSEGIQNILSRYSSFKDFFIDVTYMTNLVNSIVVAVVIKNTRVYATGRRHTYVTASLRKQTGRKIRNFSQAEICTLKPM